MPETTIREFAWQGNYIPNDWRTQPSGEGYLEAGSKGRSDLRRKILDIIAEVEPRVRAVNEEYAAKYGWTDPNVR